MAERVFFQSRSFEFVGGNVPRHWVGVPSVRGLRFKDRTCGCRRCLSLSRGVKMLSCLWGVPAYKLSVSDQLVRGWETIDAYFDESGYKGYCHNIDLNKHEIGLFSVLLIPAIQRDFFYNTFSVPFEKFKHATSGKIHITDAFASQDPQIKDSVIRCREEIFDHILRLQIPIIYEARSTTLAAKSYSRDQKSYNNLKKACDPNLKISEPYDTTTFQDSLLEGILLKMEAFAKDYYCGSIDIKTDMIDKDFRKKIEATINELKNIMTPKHSKATAYNTKTQELLKGNYTTQIFGCNINAKHLGSVSVLGKDDPIILAADIVANSLFRHLSTLESCNPLNHPSSIKGWALQKQVYGVRENAIEDCM